LCLPSGIWGWPVSQANEIDEASLRPAVTEAGEIDVLLVGSGRELWVPPDSLRWQMRGLHISMDVMTTAAAVRTYNILQGERRRVAAALVAVD
jgi:uncharacterized protein